MKRVIKELKTNKNSSEKSRQRQIKLAFELEKNTLQIIKEGKTLEEQYSRMKKKQKAA